MISWEAVVLASRVEGSHHRTYRVGWQRPQPQPGPRLREASPCYRGALHAFQWKTLGFVL